MPNTNQVSAGKPAEGMIQVAPLGTTLPTNAEDALTGFTSLGYISEDGVKNANAPDTDNVKAWGGDTVLTVQNEKPDEFTFTMIEAMSEDVLKVVYGDENVTNENGVITVNATAKEAEAHVYVIDMILTGNVPKRIVIPHGKLTDLGEITYSDGDPIGYETTIQALPDESIGGATHREFIGKKTV